ncbi:MAG: rane protein involved in the export of O-antigen and teichoic acid, partial [Chloroflexi bacterium]|nr:rane protein involved in the export of O-antigen and teichoic acid [Chloroflexota bacterium]
MSPSAPSEERDARLFADPSVNGRVVLNFAALSSSEAVARIIAFGGMLYVARRVGAANYGAIAFVSGLTLYLAKIADFGIDTIGAVEIAKRRDEIPRLGSAILGMRCTLAVVVALAAIGGAQIWLPEPERTVLSVFALTILPIAASTKWIHLGLEGALPIGVWRVAGEVLTLALIVGFVRDATHLWRVPAAVLVGDSLMTGMLGWLLVRQGYGLRPRWDPKTAVPIFVRALPVVGQILSGLFIYNSSVVFLRVMRSAEAVGLYAAAYALISFLANICSLYGMSLLPTLARLGRRSV